MNKERRYQSYLLRLWQESDASPPLWRASLERPQDGQRLGFPSLEDLFAFLENETRLILPDSENPEAEGAKEGHYETDGPLTDEPRVFASPDELSAHLRERTDTTPPAGGLEKGRRTPETGSE